MRGAAKALVVAMACAAGPLVHATGPVDPVVKAIRDASPDTSRLSSCVLLARANQVAPRSKAEERKKAIEQVSQKLKRNDVAMLRARADVARKGLYGYKKDEPLALRLYERAKAPEAGFNAALMLYKNQSAPLDAVSAKRILEVLKRSGAADANSRGSVGAQSHYIAGLIYESGLMGPSDVGKAFTHYRASARNAYVPGAYHYLRLVSQSLSKLPETERNAILQEMRMMTNRWRWQSADIMLLNGDMYAAKWIPDDDGFMAQQHWRMALRMGGSREIPDFENVLKTRIKKLPPDQEKRLEGAVEAGLRNVMRVRHDLEFADLCVE